MTVYSIAPWVRTPADVLHTQRDTAAVDAKRPRRTDKRVCASVEKTPRAVIREAFDEVLRRDPDKRRRWVVLVDGEPKQLALLKLRRDAPASWSQSSSISCTCSSTSGPRRELSSVKATQRPNGGSRIDN